MNLMLALEGLTWFPNTIAGYVSLALSVVALISIAVGYGRWLEKLNGVGGRVKELEEAKVKAETERDGFKEITNRLLTQHELMLHELGVHGRSTEACRDDTEKLGIDLGSKISDLTREVSKLNLDLSTRITRVETTIIERNGARRP